LQFESRNALVVERQVFPRTEYSAINSYIVIFLLFILRNGQKLEHFFLKLWSKDHLWSVVVQIWVRGRFQGGKKCNFKFLDRKQMFMANLTIIFSLVHRKDAHLPTLYG
jgi:hypothetical protein